MQAIRLDKNEGDVNGPNALVVSGEVQAILEKSCYDCHSNKTNYPLVQQYSTGGLVVAVPRE
jgi:hypothetical protein